MLPEAVAALADNMMLGAINEGLSANKIIGLLRGAGYGYRDQLMYSRIRELKGIAKKADSLKYVRPEYRPSEALMTEGGNWMTGNYRYVVQITSISDTTGETVTLYNNFSSNDLLTVNEANALALNNFNEHAAGSNLTVQQSQLTTVYKRSSFDGV